MKAFPEVEYVKPGDGIGAHIMTVHGGMDLRDYFAAKAMQAIVSTVPHLKTICVNDCAEEAYLYADAMMKAREQ